MSDELLTIEQVAEILHCTTGGLHNMRNKGTGPLSFKAGKRVLYRRSDIDAYIEAAREATLKGGGK